MRPDSLREWLRQIPFRPFRLHLTNGVVFEVRHPDQAFVVRDRVTLGAGDPAVAPAHRRTDVALLHITHIETIPVTPSPSAN